MDKIAFYIKDNANLSKYGLQEETKRWVFIKSVVKLVVDKKSMRLRFNMPDNTTLKIFAEMVKDDIVEITSERKRQHPYHYIGLSDDEFELIQDYRAKNKTL